MSRSLFVFLAAFVLTWIGNEPVEAEEPTSEARIEYPVSADFMVLELSRFGSLTTDLEMGPFLRIYGDGRVHVRIPKNLREWGDFEGYLSHSDVRYLLSLCARKGLMEFDRRAVEKQQSAAVRERRRKTGRVPGVADSSLTTLRIRVAGYAPAGSSAATEKLEKEISWRALSDVVSWYPEIRPLAHFQEVVEALESLQDATIEASKRDETLIVFPDEDEGS